MCYHFYGKIYGKKKENVHSDTEVYYAGYKEI